MKKSAILIILLMILSLGICGCGKDDSSQIKIGVIAELTGDVPAVGASCKNAAEMAVQEINDAGGIQLGEKKYQSQINYRGQRRKGRSIGILRAKADYAAKSYGDCRPQRQPLCAACRGNRRNQQRLF